MTTSPIRVRFAPAPTGYLHIGGARTALFNWLFARQQGGELVLRIEDTDAERTRRELIEVIYRALEWLGIDWDGEPVHQSDRGELYQAAAEKLLASGRCLLVRLRARRREGPSRRSVAASRATTRFVVIGRSGPVRVEWCGSARPMRARTAFDDEIRGHISFENADLEDFVIVRSTGVPMFLLANAVDDADLGITHIVRGEDLINVTPKVLLLRTSLGVHEVPVFAHLPLIVNEKRQKLSKRRDDVSMGDYIERGYLPEAMRNYLATLGWGAPDGVEIRPIAEIIELFRLDHVNKASAFFDLKKLNHFNGEYIRALPVPEFVDRSTHWITGPDTPWPAERFDAKVFEQLAPVVQTRVDRLAEIPDAVDFAFVDEPVVDDESWQKAMLKSPEQATAMLDARDRCVRLGRVGQRHPDDGHRRHRRAAHHAEEGPSAAGAGGAHRARSGHPARRHPRRARARRDAATVAGGSRPSLIMLRMVLRWTLRIGAALVALLVLYVGVTFGQVWWASRQDDAAPASAIVVMGAAQWDGRPSPVLKARLDHAVELWEQGHADHIIVTGGKQVGDRVTQGFTGYDYLREQGVPEEVIRVEVEGTDSYEELSASAVILRNEGLAPERAGGVGPLPRAAGDPDRRRGRAAGVGVAHRVVVVAQLVGSGDAGRGGRAHRGLSAPVELRLTGWLGRGPPR